ncbi:MAG: 3-deoxy-7-phosphoheptulonate synthase [candidate division WS1 bacterium]|nr:3-deoxy-7-phosphoheptulonate synthase [candidate division WS1 bacterium]
MIIVMQAGASEPQIQRVVARLTELGYEHHISYGVEHTLIGAVGAPEGEKEALAGQLSLLPGVERVVPILRPYKLVSREHATEPSVVRIGKAPFGRGQVSIIAGPCAIESEKQILEAAKAVKAAGGAVLRGGAYKPRTSPYTFQGMGEPGLQLLSAAREATGLPILTEVTDVRQLEEVTRVADSVQIGARNMQNYDLLRECGQISKPVVLKRGFAATVQEWLRAAEYIAAAGNLDIILCERGIRTFETETRFTLDLGGLAAAKLETHLPIIADPSHATGTHKLVPAMALAALAAGADGLMIEMHPHPDRALSDGPQSLTPKRLKTLMDQIRPLVAALGLELISPERG